MPTILPIKNKHQMTRHKRLSSHKRKLHRRKLNHLVTTTKAMSWLPSKENTRKMQQQSHSYLLGRPHHFPSMEAPLNSEWPTKLLWFDQLIQQNLEELAQLEGTQELLRTFIEIDTVIIPRKGSISVTMQLMKKVLGLCK